MTKPLSLGRKIRRMRENKDYSQEWVAHELGMSISGYSRIERDEVSVNLEKLHKIASILQIELNDLVNHDASPVFNNLGHANDQSFSNHNHLNGDFHKMESIYKEQIQHLEDEIRYLRLTIDRLIEKK